VPTGAGHLSLMLPFTFTLIENMRPAAEGT